MDDQRRGDRSHRRRDRLRDKEVYQVDSGPVRGEGRKCRGAMIDLAPPMIDDTPFWPLRESNLRTGSATFRNSLVSAYDTIPPVGQSQLKFCLPERSKTSDFGTPVPHRPETCRQILS